MKNVLLLFSSFLLFSCSATGQEQPSELDKKIERIETGLMKSLQFKGEKVKTYTIRERLKELGIPGISIAVATNGRIEWARAYGMADIGLNKKMTTNTLLLAGSISKPVAAIRGIQLVEEGKVGMDNNVNDYLSSWKVPDNDLTTTEKVTLRRILNHTAGLSVWAFPGYTKGASIPSVIDILDGWGNTGSVRVYKKPGESWQYSGGGYTVMQLMITDMDTISFPKTMKKNVLEPLGMEKSTFENPLPEKYHSIAATGYRKNGYEVAGKWSIYPEMAAAGLWTTPSELIQYAIEIQKIFNSGEDGLISYAHSKEMLTPGMKDHGLGPRITKSTFEHGGDDQGFKAQLTAWKDGSHAVVIMVNSDNASIIDEVLLSMAKEYKLPDIEPTIVEVIEFPDNYLQKYVGSYNVRDIGTVQLKTGDKGLTLNAPFLDRPIELVAESDSVFFDKDEGTRIVFSFQGEKVSKFTLEGLLTAIRIK